MSRWKSSMYFHCFNFFLLIDIKKFINQPSFWNCVDLSVAAIILLRIQEFGTHTQKQYEQSVTINLIYGICNEGYCIVHYIHKCTLYIFYITKIYNKIMNVCAYICFLWLLNICLHTSRDSSRAHGSHGEPR